MSHTEEAGPALSLGHMSAYWIDSASRNGERTATRVQTGKDWRTTTFADLDGAARGIAGRLIEVGIQPGDRVAILANNCPEWTQVDLACILTRAISVPLYTTSTAEQISHILADSSAKVMVVGGQAEGERLIEVLDQLPELSTVVSIEPWEGMPENFVALADFTAEVDLSERLSEASGEEILTLIYTSGTTGSPKGVMITNTAMLAQIDAIVDLFEISPEDHSLCFLPLSHAFERGWTYVLLGVGCMNTYVANARKVADLLPVARPTLMVSVPKLYETVFKVAHAKVASSVAKRAIFTWAFRVGGRLQRAYRKGKRPTLFWRAQLPLADALVFKNIRQAMGGPKSVLASGGAPLRQEIAEFFSAAGLLICEGFGMTEASPMISFNSPTAFKFGTCGKVVPGGEIRIGDHSEILYRGPNLMAGYWNDPEATAATIEDGWLHTGDAGYVDTNGYLVITDRIKDIIVTSGGKNVSPQPIEGLLLADPLFEHAVLLGDNRPSLTLLVRPSLPAMEELAKHFQWPGGFAEWVEHPDFLAEVKRRVAELTSKLPSHEQVRATHVLTDEFTTENGLLTPTMKIRRREVETRFKDAVEAMYEKIASRKKD